MNDVFIHLNYPSVEIHNTKCETLLQEAALILKMSGISDNHELLELTLLLKPRKSVFIPPATSPAVGERVGIILHLSKGRVHQGKEFVADLRMLWSTKELSYLLLHHSDWILVWGITQGQPGLSGSVPVGHTTPCLPRHCQAAELQSPSTDPPSGILPEVFRLSGASVSFGLEEALGHMCLRGFQGLEETGVSAGKSLVWGGRWRVSMTSHAASQSCNKVPINWAPPGLYKS